jgi:hypothetical protein
MSFIPRSRIIEVHGATRRPRRNEVRGVSQGMGGRLIQLMKDRKRLRLKRLSQISGEREKRA